MKPQPSFTVSFQTAKGIPSKEAWARYFPRLLKTKAAVAADIAIVHLYHYRDGINLGASP